MKVYFRADASAHMGTGHLMRCLTLAEALRERGVQTRFITRDHPGNLLSLLRLRSQPMGVLPPPLIAGAGEEDYGSWLGASQAEDAAQTLHAFDAQELSEECLPYAIVVFEEIL